MIYVYLDYVKLNKIIIFALISFGLSLTACHQDKAGQTQRADTYDHVMASGKIRCGYLEWPPVLQKDINTKQFSGVGVDIMKEIANRLKLSLSWDEEVGPATAAESVKSGRVDMMCMPLIITMARVRVVDFSEPVMFSRFSPWVKTNSAVTDTTNMNDERYRFVYIDGTGAASLTERFLPKTQHITLVENTPTSDLFLSVMTGKADAVYTDTSTIFPFEQNQPGQMRPVLNSDMTMRMPWAFMVAQDNYRFVHMINLVLQDMHYDGTLERILQKNKAESYFTMTVQQPPQHKNWQEQ